MDYNKEAERIAVNFGDDLKKAPPKKPAAKKK
jgi:hypothetical protein